MSRRYKALIANRSGWCVAFCVFALAAIVRLWGIQHDLPYSYYGDEAHLVKRALSFGSGDLNPHWFHKPAFYMYVLFFEHGLYYCVGYVIGLWSSVSEFAVSYVQNPGPFYLIGRVTTVLFSLGCLWAVYRIGERHFGKYVGLIAALLLSLTYGHVDASRAVKADIPAACLGLWSMYFLLNHTKDGRAKSLVLASVLAGIATATKYYALPMLLPLCAVALLVRRNGRANAWRKWSRRFGFLSIALAVFWGSYFVCAPYNFLDARGRKATFRHFQIASERGRELVTGEAAARSDDFVSKRRDFLGGMLDYAAVLLSRHGMGIVIASLCLLGCGMVVASREWPKLVFVLYAAAFAIASVFAFPGYAAPRHQCPLYPFLAVCGGVFVVNLSHLLGSRRWLVYGVLLLAMCYPLSHVIQRAVDLSKEDTRNVAKHWIEENVPVGSKLLADENGPNLLVSERRLKSVLKEAVQEDPQGEFTAHYASYLQYQLLAAKQAVSYELHEIRLPWWREKLDKDGTHKLDSPYDRNMGNPLRPVGVESYDYYVEKGFKYAVVHSGRYARFFREDGAVRERYPAMSRFYRDLFAHGRLIKEFSSHENGFRGPVVRIYEFAAASQDSD